MFQNQIGMNPYMAGMPKFSPGINWVNGLQEVDSFDLPPGGMAVFIDKVNDGMMYIRTRDIYNVYSTRVFKYSEVQTKQPDSPYVTRSELEELFQRFLGGGNNVTVQSANGANATGAASAESSTAGQSAGGRKRKTNDADVAGSE